jgi:hypothetical protein
LWVFLFLRCKCIQLLIPLLQAAKAANFPTLSIDMLVSVRTLDGTKFDLEITPDDTIGGIKEKIEAVAGHPTNEQRLIYAGKRLEDHRTADDYGVIEGGILHLVLRLRRAPI